MELGTRVNCRSYLVECMDCHVWRTVGYAQFMLLKRRPMLCISCTSLKSYSKGRWVKGYRYSQSTEFKKGHVSMDGFKKGHTPWNKGIKRPEMSGEKSPVWKGGVIDTVCKNCGGVATAYLSQKRLYCSRKCMHEATKKFGEEHPKWIKDRTQLKKRQMRNDSAYQEWRKQVWLRDNFKCKIANPDCAGQLEAHHILPWRDYQELRYQVNNGITLCHFHHPRRWEEEKRLSPYFTDLVSVSSE